MHFWRKSLALLLLMVFLPATVLAAMPVKLCVGADGHRAIESAIGGDHHEAAVDVASDSDLLTASVELPDCVDFDVMTLASAIRHSGDQSKSAQFDEMPPAVLLDSGLQLSSLAVRHECVFKSAEGVDTDPFLIAHATVVLLI